MHILALDTALGATAVAILDRANRQVVASRSDLMARGHAEALVPMVRDVMAEAGIGWESIGRIATTVGPGSFTGLRVAVAAARAFALARSLPVVGVSTLTAYAAPVLAARSGAAVASVIDARHGAVFFARFAGDGRAAAAPALLPLEDAVSALRLERTALVGNAATLLHDAASALGIASDVIDAAPAPDIAWVARLGAAAEPEAAPALPLYLRPPSAVPQGGAIARAGG